MKKIICFLLIGLLTMSVCGCSNSGGDIVDTRTEFSNLEFWITENVDGFDFSDYEEKVGLIDGNQYYGKKYKIDDADMLSAEKYVLYTVSSYPDYSSETKHITGIYITDPSIYFFGLNVDSSPEEIVNTMKQFGYKFIGDATDITYKRDNVTITFDEKGILIKAKVTNIVGILS